MVSRFSLSGEVVVVTGGSRGIGRAIAIGLAEAGADVVIASRTRTDLDQVVEEARERGRKSFGVPTAVSRAADVAVLVKTTLETFGRIDVLVNSAGISPVYSRAVHLREDDWDQVIAVNLTGAFLCCRAVGRVMVEQRSGKIINVGSIGATTGLPRFVAYCASKGGLLQITRGLAVGWGEHKVQVNAIVPG